LIQLSFHIIHFSILIIFLTLLIIRAIITLTIMVIFVSSLIICFLRKTNIFFFQIILVFLKILYNFLIFTFKTFIILLSNKISSFFNPIIIPFIIFNYNYLPILTYFFSSITLFFPTFSFISNHYFITVIFFIFLRFLSIHRPSRCLLHLT